jgi:two-component system, OmpR family, sensor histidine kinase SenX3
MNTSDHLSHPSQYGRMVGYHGTYHHPVEWPAVFTAPTGVAGAGALVATLIVAAVVAVVAVVAAGRRRSRPEGTDRDGRPVIATQPRDPRGGLARKSLDSLRVGVVVLDSDDEPVLVNPSARAMGLLRAGLSPGTIVVHPIVRTLAVQVRRSGVRREVELDLPRGGGTADPLGVLLRAVALGGGHVAVEASDVTESHRVARVRRDFVANVGHELKTPIGALQLLAEALLDATDQGGAPATDPAADVAAARRFAERIQHESTRLGRLVTELLELSRVQGAEPLPEPTPVPVDSVLAEVLDRARTGAVAKRITLNVTGAAGLTAYGSDNQLATAVTNLVENAVAYSPEGSEVVVDRVVEDDWLAIRVIDRGIGIAPEDLDRVFERFYRSDRARSRATGGTGLGLAIVKHIATNHGGRVDVASRPGEGSTFTLWLPARPTDVAGTSPAPGGIDIGGAPVPQAPVQAGGGGQE